MTGLPGTARAIREHPYHRASARYYAKTSVTGLPGTPRAIREHPYHRASADYYAKTSVTGLPWTPRVIRERRCLSATTVPHGRCPPEQH